MLKILRGCEATEWAAYRKTKTAKPGTKAEMKPVESKCRACATIHVRAFPHMEWAQLLAECKTNEVMKKSVQVAKRVLAGDHVATWTPQRVEESKETFVKIQKRMQMITEQEFEKQYNIKLSLCPQIAELFDDMVDERGRRCRAILLTDAQTNNRWVVVEHQTGVHLQSSLLDAKDMLRPDQGLDLMQWRIQQRDPVDKPFLRAGMGVPDLEQMVEEARARAVANQSNSSSSAAQQPSAAEAAAAAPLADSPSKQDSDHIVSTVPALMMPSLEEAGGASKKAKGQGKGKAKAKAKSAGGGPKSPKRRLWSSGLSVSPKKRARSDTLSGVDGGGVGSGDSLAIHPDDSVSVAGKTVSMAGSKRLREPGSGASSVAVGNKGAPLDKMQQYAAYMSPSYPQMALDGQKVKTALYQSRRLLGCFKPDSSERLTLSAQIDLIESCEALSATFSTMSSEEREAKLSEISLMVDKFPPSFQDKIVSQRASEIPLRSATHMEAFRDLVRPVPCAGGTFSCVLEGSLLGVAIESLVSPV